MAKQLLEEVSRVGLRPIAEATEIPISTIVDWMHNPEQMPMGRFLKLVETLGGAAQLIFAPEPLPSLDRRRKHMRQFRRGPTPATTQGENS